MRLLRNSTRVTVRSRHTESHDSLDIKNTVVYIDFVKIITKSFQFRGRLLMIRIIMIITVFLFSIPAFADIILIEKQGGGVEQKILISGDKVQVRKRMDSEMVNTGMAGRMQQAQGILSSKASVDKAKAQYATSQGYSASEIEKAGKMKRDTTLIDQDIQAINTTRSSDGKLSPANQARYDELMAKKKDMETLTPDGETVYDKKKREQAQRDINDLQSQKDDLAKETVDKSLKIETYRFDQGRYYVVTPSKGTYTETTIEEERNKRGKSANSSSSSASATSELKVTGETETVNGISCTVYQGTLTVSGRALASDRICIAKTGEQIAREYWNAQNKLLLDVGPSNPNPVERFFVALQKSYIDELAKLPGIPLKRTMSMGRAGAGSFEVETTIVSTDKIGAEQFELPADLTKK